MSFSNSHKLRFYKFDSFPVNQIKQGVFTRHGGVSPHPWKSLNLGGTVGDDIKNIIENRRLLFDSINLRVDSLFDVWQVHSDIVITVEKARGLENDPVKADAIITNNPQVTLFMRFADCVPVFLYDPVRRVVGMVHAGWEGTVRKIASITVQAMEEQFECNPQDMLAGIGPSICVRHYEIKQDVANQVKMAFGSESSSILKENSNKLYFDLWSANELVLQNAGVKQIEVAGICTACNLEDWYSHREENGITGRFGAILALSN